MSKQIENGISRVYPDSTDGREGYLGLRLTLGSKLVAEEWLDIEETVSPVYDLWLGRALSATLGARASQEEGPGEMFAKMIWQAGEWQSGVYKSERVGGSRVFPAKYEAIAKIQGISVEQAKRLYLDLPKEKRKFVDAREDVKAGIVDIEKMRATAGSLDSMLS